MSIVTELLDLHYVLGITAASKHETENGNVFVDLRLDVQEKDTLKPDSLEKTSTVSIRLSLPQFYQLLSELEEAKHELVKATEQ